MYSITFVTRRVYTSWRHFFVLRRQYKLSSSIVVRLPDFKSLYISHVKFLWASGIPRNTHPEKCSSIGSIRYCITNSWKFVKLDVKHAVALSTKWLDG
jgi:hypothetical protein